MPATNVEDRIAAIVAHTLGARAIRRDVAGSSIRDFDHRFLDGHLEPLEVTSYADEAALATWGRADKLNSIDKRTERRRPTRLTKHWLGSVPARIDDGTEKGAPYPFREHLRSIEDALLTLETRGIDRFEAVAIVRSGDPSLRNAGLSLLNAGVEYVIGRDTGPGTDPGFYPASSVGGITTVAAVTAAIEAVANEEDNCEKLREPAHAPRRHLFIDFTASSGVAFNAADRELIGPVPTLPDPITTVWISTNCAGGARG